ncbi:MAG: glycosyltransferase [bacterium]
MKNVLIVITKGEIGGAQMSVINLAKQLKIRGFTITVAFGTGDFLMKELASEHIDCIKLPYLGRSYNLISNIRYIIEFRRLLLKNNYDVIHFNSTNAVLGAISAKLIKKNIKTIFTFRGLSVLDPNYTHDKIKKFLYLFAFKFILLFVDYQIYVSKTNQNVAKKLKINKRDSVVYNGLDILNLSFLNKKEAREYIRLKIGINLKNKTIIGSIGRLAYQKNYEFLIKCMAKIIYGQENLLCIIVGDGPENAKLKKMISELNLNNKIILAGPIENAGLYIKAFDIFTLTSRYEGMSITLIEAMAAGLPIIASDIEANVEILQGTGVLYSENDDHDYLIKMENILNNNNYQTELSKKTQIAAQQYTIEKTTEKYIDIYSS